MRPSEATSKRDQRERQGEDRVLELDQGHVAGDQGHRGSGVRFRGYHDNPRKTTRLPHSSKPGMQLSHISFFNIILLFFNKFLLTYDHIADIMMANESINHPHKGVQI